MDNPPDITKIGETRLKAKSLDDDYIVVLSCLRNEQLRLPAFINYYRALGVDRFLFIDNESTDDTADIIDDAPDSIRFIGRGSYSQSNFGVNWTNFVSSQYARDRWVITVDADELLIFPFVEIISIKELVKYLDITGANAMGAPLMDMYSLSPLNEINYYAGDDLLKCLSYFDRSGYEYFEYAKTGGYDSAGCGFPPLISRGGPRSRLFKHSNAANREAPWLQKFPVVKWTDNFLFTDSTHKAKGRRISDVSGLLLHFKFLNDFYFRSIEETIREEHWNSASEYKVYLDVIARFENFVLPCKETEKFKGTEQLLEFGLISAPDAFCEFIGINKL